MRILMFYCLLSLLPTAAANDAADLYAMQCAACHGERALGNKETASPRLAGQNTAYLREQIIEYQRGRRGTHPDHTDGQGMQLAALTLSEPQVEALSSYLANRSGPEPAQPIHTQEPGAELYRTECADCHGQYGQGAESIFAPNLRILSAWYLEAQLIAYTKGWRGGHTASTRSQNMRAINGQLTDPSDRNAVIHHIAGFD